MLQLKALHGRSLETGYSLTSRSVARNFLIGHCFEGLNVDWCFSSSSQISCGSTQMKSLLLASKDLSACQNEIQPQTPKLFKIFDRLRNFDGIIVPVVVKIHKSYGYIPTSFDT